MSTNAPSPHALRASDLAAKPHRFAMRPGPEALKDIADALGLEGLRKLSFQGEVRPAGKRDWGLTATLGATIEQLCTVTLAPVRTRIDTQITRRFVSGFVMPEDPETEMPEDDSIEPLGEWIDIEAVMIEALSLEVPPYPRAADATFESAQFAASNVVPLTDEAAKPFAGLAALKARMDDKDE